MMKICVLGLGYIGLPTAAMFATHGFEVVGVDVNGRVVDLLNRGEVHIQEEAVHRIVLEALASGRLRVSLTPEKADVFIIAVPTPLGEAESKPERTPVPSSANASGQASRPSGGDCGGSAEIAKADLGYVIAAAHSLIPYLAPGNLVVLESTSPPRTTEDVLAPILERSGLPTRACLVQPDGRGRSSGDSGANGDGVAASSVNPNLARSAGPVHDSCEESGERLYVAHCPERVLPGRIVEELVQNDRIVGGLDLEAGEKARRLYESFVEGELLVTDATTAEMVKLMENTYRDVNIALANELALVAERVGIDVWEAIRLANRHPRVNILKPGPGVGGHCIAVDPWFIAEAAPDLTPLIQTARRVNDGMPAHVVELVKRALAERYGDEALLLENRRRYVIGCLGLAYKADVDDCRESPAVAVVTLLSAQGFRVHAYDPEVRERVVDGQVSSLDDCINQADMIVLLVNHGGFRDVEAAILSMARHIPLLDTRNALFASSATEDSTATVSVRRLGVGRSAALSP